MRFIESIRAAGPHLGAAFACALVACAAAAGDMPEPSPAAAEMLKSMREKGILDQTEYEALYRKQAKYEADQRETDATPPWLRDWTVGGDFRLRYERIDHGNLNVGENGNITPGKDDVLLLGGARGTAFGVQQRWRMRFRIGAEHRVGEDFTVGFRIATASATTLQTRWGDQLTGTPVTGDSLSKTLIDYRSENTTLGNYFEPKGIYLDQAYLRWNPVAAPTLKLSAGKVANPFVSKRFPDLLVWDHDINPEGLSLTYRFDFVPEKYWTELAGGVFILNEVNGIRVDCPPPGTSCKPTYPVTDDKDPFILGIQLGFYGQPFDWLGAGVRGSYYQFQHLGIADSAFVIDLGNGGTSIDDNPLFSTLPPGSFHEDSKSRGRVREASVDGYFTVRPFDWLPITPFVQYSTLLSARDENDGWAGGVTLGKPDLLELTVMWAQLDRNGAYAPFTDSDLFDGFTNAKGWYVTAQRQLSEHMRLRVAWMRSKLAQETCLSANVAGTQGLFCDSASAVFLNGALLQFRKTDLDRDRIQVDLTTEF